MLAWLAERVREPRLRLANAGVPVRVGDPLAYAAAVLLIALAAGAAMAGRP